MKGKKIPGYKNMSKSFSKFLNPKYVYIPLIVRDELDVTVLVKKGNYVYKGMMIAKTKKEKYIPIYSSVSGFVVDTEVKTLYNNREVKCLKIENDFKEKYEEDNTYKLNEYTKEEFTELLRLMNIRGMGGADFPTYIKYEADKINMLVVNAIECEPYITADYTVIMNHIEEILEAIDAILEINKIDKCYIAIKKTNSKVKEKINTFLGTYPKIKLYEARNVYPMGWEKFLIREITKQSYNVLPSEKNIVVNNISTIYAIYEALKYHKPLMERIVTITGPMVKKPQNILVKVGTSVKDIIDNVGLKRNKDVVLVCGGPMMGKSVNDNLVITSNINCLLFLKDEELFISDNCFRCGKCSDVCPNNLSPVLIKDNLRNKERLKTLKPNLCVECGLCSYVCPAKINLRDYVVKAKGEVK